MPEADNQTPSATPPPRAFAQGTGVLLQTVGVIMFLISGCLWTTGGEIQPPDPAEPSLAQTGAMLTIVAATVAGCALAVLGLGLQTDKAYAAYGAFSTNLLLTITLIIAAFLLWTSNAATTFRITNAITLALSLFLIPFTTFALREIRKNPPPKGMEILPPDAKIPYSHLHDDPPEVRLKKELENRKQKLLDEQRNIERLEQELDSRNKE